MKRIVSFVLVCTLLAAVCLLSACGPTALKKDESGGFVNPKTDIAYYPAALNYYAKPFGEDAYARIELDNGGDDVLLYAIEGADPERYLVSNGYTVYCAAGAELPELKDLLCTRVGIYDTQVASNDGNITDATEIAALKKLHAEGSATTLNNVGIFFDETTQWYDLRFMGDGDCAGIYYQLKYGVFDEDILITELVERDENGYMIDYYPGVPYEIEQKTFEGKEFIVAVYNFGKEILCDMTSGKCYRIDSSLLSYVDSAESAQ